MIQQIYTFVEESAQRRSGAQSVFVSPGLSPQQQELLERFCLYEAPSWLGPREELSKYPVSFSYFPIDAQFVAIGRTLYRGAYGGRAGNFLSHHIVLPIRIWQSQSPLALWSLPNLFVETETQPLATEETLTTASAPSATQPEVLHRLFGEQTVEIVSRVFLHLQHGAPRVVVPLPEASFVEMIPEALASLVQLLPTSLRPRVSCCSYQSDPSILPFALTCTPEGSPQLRALSGNKSLYIVNNYDRLPRTALTYCVETMLAAQQDTASLSLLQYLLLQLSQLGTVTSFSEEHFQTLQLAATTVDTESINKLLDGVAAHPDRVSALAEDLLLPRLGRSTLQGFRQGRGSRTSARVLVRLLQREPSEEAYEAAYCAAGIAAEEPQQAPWEELGALLAVLPRERHATFLAALAPAAPELGSLLPEKDLPRWLSSDLLPDTIRWSIFAHLSQEKRLGDFSTYCESFALALSPTDSLRLVFLLRQSGEEVMAASLLLYQVLPRTEDPSALLAETVACLRSNQYSDDALGKELLSAVHTAAIPTVICFGFVQQLLAAWRETLATLDSRVMAEAATRLGEQREAFLQELARLGLQKTLWGIRLVAQEAEGKDPLEEVLRPLLAEENVLELETCLAAFAADKQAAALEMVLARAHEHWLSPKIFALVRRLQQQSNTAVLEDVFWAWLLSENTWSVYGVHQLTEALQRCTPLQRKEKLQSILKRLVISPSEEAALARTLCDVWREQSSWLTQLQECATEAGFVTLPRNVIALATVPSQH